MKVSVNWLNEFVDVSVSADELAQRLSLAGLEVAAIESANPGFDAVVIAEVINVSPHPDADKLRVCQVSTGSGKPLQIVCGAANVETGMKAALVQVGGHLPDGTHIKKSKLRGVESQGMLCSARELGLAEDAAGLWALPEDAPVGVSLADWLALDDSIIEIELTPNRGDCLSVLGVAREVSAIFTSELNLPQTLAITGTLQDSLPVDLQAKQACARFCGQIIRNLRADTPAPMWMQERLRRVGIRPISLVVDVTQYVMLEYGQPLHAYDLQQLHGGIVVRQARPDEQLTLLDDTEVTLAPDFLVIADQQQALGLAGIMGGAGSAVQSGSTDIYLECAWFAPAAINGRARQLGLQTDASYRFERGVDPAGQQRAIARAAALILQYAGGEAGPLTVAESPEHLPAAKSIRLRHARLEQLLGITLAPAAVAEPLEHLGFVVITDKPMPDSAIWQVTPPSQRFDIEIEEDVIEEIIRIHGYDQIPAAYYPLPQKLKAETEQPANPGRLREVLVQRGYYEAITYSFVGEALQQRLCGSSGLALANPITSEMTHMRQSLWPGLLQALQYNRNRQQERIRLFETGLRFKPRDSLKKTMEVSDIKQQNVVAGVVCGALYPVQWGIAAKNADFADVRADVEALLALGGRHATIKFEPVLHAALHPGQSASIIHNNQVIGNMGMLHPEHQAALELPRPVFMFELEIAAISNDHVPKYRELSRFPSMRRDLALLLPEDTPAQELLDSIAKHSKELLNKLELFDVYHGEGIDSGKKSLAIGLTFQRSSSTLTEVEVDALVQTILVNVRTELGAELRD
ncbi:MAG: phenylalanine--tRNA ligase subunit beta [Gammaproteobacteria bacterium]